VRATMARSRREPSTRVVYAQLELGGLGLEWFDVSFGAPAEECPKVGVGVLRDRPLNLAK
jgi:hypothetical protein